MPLSIFAVEPASLPQEELEQAIDIVREARHAIHAFVAMTAQPQLQNDIIDAIRIEMFRSIDPDVFVDRLNASVREYVQRAVHHLHWHNADDPVYVAVILMQNSAQLVELIAFARMIVSRGNITAEAIPGTNVSDALQLLAKQNEMSRTLSAPAIDATLNDEEPHWEGDED